VEISENIIEITEMNFYDNWQYDRIYIQILI